MSEALPKNFVKSACANRENRVKYT
jgi:hypothetical protein